MRTLGYIVPIIEEILNLTRIIPMRIAKDFPEPLVPMEFLEEIRDIIINLLDPRLHAETALMRIHTLDFKWRNINPDKRLKLYGLQRITIEELVRIHLFLILDWNSIWIARSLEEEIHPLMLSKKRAN
jgi:hypothetical protein